jgi:predicted ester cyclase
MIKLSALFCISLLAMLPVLASCTGDSSTSEIEQRNKEIIQQAHARLQAGDIDGYKSLISPNYIRHCQAMPPELQEIHGTEKFFGFIEEFMKAVPVYTDSLSNMIAEGDKVAYVSTLIGTMTGPMGGFPATGKSFTLENIIIQRLEDGKVVETWISWDNVSFLSQLGLMPGPEDGSK